MQLRTAGGCPPSSPPGTVPGPKVGDFGVRAEAGGLTPIRYAKRQRRSASRCDRSRTAICSLSKEVALKRLQPVPFLPDLQAGVATPLKPDRSFGSRLIGTASRAGDVSPCWGGNVPDPHTSIPRAPFGTEGSNRRLSPSLGTGGLSTGASGFGLRRAIHPSKDERGSD
jgi:hypothetical protein